jgi:hypothetical protein
MSARVASSESLNSRAPFLGCYSPAVIAAATPAFGVAHAAQSLVVGLPIVRIPADFLGYELLQAAAFMVFGWELAYIPARILARRIGKTSQNRLPLCVISGLSLGLLFLPLCAGVAVLVFRIFPFLLGAGPTFLARCAEFALPMEVAGAAGGYAFWRRARAMEAGHKVGDPFS